MLLLVSCNNDSKIQIIKFGPLEEKILNGTHPRSVDSLAELQSLGKVIHSNTGWCVLIYFGPIESVGFGNAIIYRKIKNSWVIFKSSDRILLPNATLSKSKIVVTGEKSLNNRSRVEVMVLEIDNIP